MNPSISTCGKRCVTIDLGRIGYPEACELQHKLVAARKAGVAPDLLLFCEHSHVLTLGRNARIEHLLAPLSALDRLGVALHQCNRGGDITYHGPGQIVCYPIMDLAGIRRDVQWYVRQLEEVMIRASEAFGGAAFRVSGRTGVWARVPGERPQTEEKLGAIGVHISRWVTSHGFAYNVCTDVGYFDLIVPCGIAGCRATSLEKLIRRPLSPSGVLPRLADEFGRAFGLEMQAGRRGDLDEWLALAESQALAAVSASR